MCVCVCVCVPQYVCLPPKAHCPPAALSLTPFAARCQVQGTQLSEARIVFYGAGSSACGVAAMIVQLLQSQVRRFL